MKMKMNKKILAAAAIVLPLTIGSGSALAYFTANVTAAGGRAVEVGTNTDITEEVENGWKKISITNTGGGAVFVRVKIFVNSLERVDIYDGNDKWTLEDDNYYYYNEALEPGDTTELLEADVKNNVGLIQDNYNVVVVYEQTPAEYVTDANGNTIAKTPTEEDWANGVRLEETLPKLEGGDNK